MALLYLGVGRSLFLGELPVAEIHRHKTLEIVLSLDHPFRFRTDTTSWRTGNSIAIPPGVFHKLRDLNGTHISIHLIAERRLNGRHHNNPLSTHEIQSLDEFDFSIFRNFFRRMPQGEVDCSEVFRMCELLVDRISGAEGNRAIVDERLLSVLEFIELNLPLRIQSRQLARIACLSEDRFLHLFTEQLGLPLRHHIMHQRLLRATRAILTGASATHAAIDSGFSDSAHLTKTFIQLTGIRPSHLKLYCGRVSVYSCASSRCIRPTRTEPGGGLCNHCGLYEGQSTPE
jgi:AraC-like DNA-binding protein